jgi:hypothetical protein
MHLATGERRWRPFASMGGLGTPVAHSDTILVATLGTNEPFMPAVESVLAKYDKDQDGRLSLQEFRDDADLGEHFGWLDANNDNSVDAQEWNAARPWGGRLRGDRPPASQRAGPIRDGASLAVYEEPAYVPAPLVYKTCNTWSAVSIIIVQSSGVTLKRSRRPWQYRRPLPPTARCIWRARRAS